MHHLTLPSVHPLQLGYFAKVCHHRSCSTRIPISDEGRLDTDIPSESLSRLKLWEEEVVWYVSLMRFFVQHQDDINIGCNPDGYPTNDYIERYMTSERRVHHFKLTFSVGISTHIPTQTSHRGWVPQVLAVSISHGRRIASSTSAERHSRWTPLPMCNIWTFPDICIRTDLSVRSSTVRWGLNPLD